MLRRAHSTVRTPTGNTHTPRRFRRKAAQLASSVRSASIPLVVVPLVMAVVTVLPAGAASAAVASHTGGQQWSAISSFPAEPEASSISCPSTSDCYVVGENTSNAPELLVTNDGGTTWTPSALPAQAGTEEIACPSTSTCFLLSYRTVFMTTDGGSTWSSKPLPSGAYGYAMACPSAATCYVAGQDTNGNGVVFATTDSGSTWATGPVAASSPVMGYISCPTSSTCFAVGVVYGQTSDTVVIIETTDGGAQWTSQSESGFYNATGISCPTQSTCYVPIRDANGNAVLTSSDGGTTWTTESLPANSDGQTVACPSALVCYMASGFGGKASMEVTTDGGTTWSSDTLPTDANDLVTIACPSTSECIIAGVNMADGDLFIAGTSDGGGTWADQTTPMGIGPFTDVACPTQSECYAISSIDIMLASSQCSGNGCTFSAPVQFTSFYSTSDGGSTWKVVNLPSGMVALGMVCPAAGTCYVNAQYGQNAALLATTNGGSTWTAETLPSGVLYLDMGLVCPTATTCYAVATNAQDAPVIIMTADGGSTWTTEPAPSGVSYYSVLACPSPTTCYITGTNAQNIPFLDATADSGSTWTTVSLPSSVTAVSNIVCPSTSVCQVEVTTAQSNNALIATIDGGTTWTTESLPSGDAQGIAFTCPTTTTCYMSGSTAQGGLLILATTDGGTTWTAQSVPAETGAVDSFACTSATACIAGGDGTGDIGALVLSTQPPSTTPTVTSISPSSGPAAGGTQVSITGTNFTTAGTTVAFGNTAATGVSCSSTTTCTATSPAGSGTVDVTVTTSSGTSAASAGDKFTYVTFPVGYHALSPARICDTRASQPANQCTNKALKPGGTDVIDVAGKGGVPASGATAVVVNVTAANPTAASYLTVWPDGETRPLASSLNFAAGDNVPNLVTVALPQDGKIDVYNAAGTVDLLVDVEGYDAAEATAGTGLYNALSPARICDTRASQPVNPCTKEAPAPGGTLDVQVTGKGGVPTTGVAAAVLNVTAIDSQAPGYLTVFAQGATKPTASNLNYRAGEVVPNRVIVPVSSSGQISIFTGNGSPEIAVDVSGYFTDASNPSAHGAQFTPAPAPVRICDTRTGQKQNSCTGKVLSAGGSLSVQAAGAAGVPADATAVVLNITAAGSTTGGYFTVYPTGQPMPVASDLNFSPAEDVANMAVATLGSGSFSVYNARGSTELIVDLVGWYS